MLCYMTGHDPTKSQTAVTTNGTEYLKKPPIRTSFPKKLFRNQALVLGGGTWVVLKPYYLRCCTKKIVLLQLVATKIFLCIFEIQCSVPEAFKHARFQNFLLVNLMTRIPENLNVSLLLVYFDIP